MVLKLPEESSLDKVGHSFCAGDLFVRLCKGQGDTVVSKIVKVSTLKKLQKIDNWYLNKQKQNFRVMSAMETIMV